MASSFRRDPLGAFDEHLQKGDDAFWLTPSMLCVAEPVAAKAVLANPEGLFEEHSDFFHTSRGPFGPRPLQQALGRSARQLLTARTAARDGAFGDSIARHLAPHSEWPDAGNWLIYHHLRNALVAPERSEHLGALLEDIVERAVLAGARERRTLVSRFFFRRRAFAALRREIDLRRRQLAGRGSLHPETAPRDLFDVLALCAHCAAGTDVRSSDLGELYLPFFFAVVSSVGFTLAWALYMLGTNPETDSRAADVVRESLRLWPIAWQTGRRPAKAHEIAGIEVTPKTQVVVSAYVTQRHPAHWREPGRFLPQRWADRGERTRSGDVAYFPFGWGPHTCAAASLSLQLATAAVAELRSRYRLQVTPLSDRPHTGPSLAPPRFRLDLAPLNSDPPLRRR